MGLPQIKENTLDLPFHWECLWLHINEIFALLTQLLKVLDICPSITFSKFTAFPGLFWTPKAPKFALSQSKWSHWALRKFISGKVPSGNILARSNNHASKIQDICTNLESDNILQFNLLKIWRFWEHKYNYCGGSSQ